MVCAELLTVPNTSSEKSNAPVSVLVTLLINTTDMMKGDSTMLLLKLPKQQNCCLFAKPSYAA